MLIILKIIGIVLLTILGLILLLVLLVLLVPVRYRFKGSYDETFFCKGKVTWLLNMISISVLADKKAEISVRILGIPLSVFMKKKVAEGESTTKTDQPEFVPEMTAELVCKEGIAEETKIKEAAVSDTITEKKELEEKKNFKDRVIQKIRELGTKLKEWIQKIKDIFLKIREFLVGMKQKKDTWKRYLEIVKSDTAKAAFSTCKKRLFRTMKHLFPRKMRVNITYGMNDPADTGYILAVYGMLPEFIGKRVSLHADFEQAVLKGDFYLRGKIRGGTLLYQILSVVLDKNCQRLYHIVKKEIANERK